MPDSDYAKTPDRNSFSTRCFQVFTHERNKNSRCPASRKVVKKWKLFRLTPTSKAHLFSGKPYSQTREFTQRSTCVTATLPLVVRAAPLVVWRGWRCWQAAASQPRGAASSSLIGVLWILAVHRRQHSNRWRRWRTWLAHAVCSCHVPQLQNAPPPPPQHPTSDEGHSWRRRASSQHHGTGIVDGILCILCRCRCVQRRRTPSILRPHARAERALPERLLALTVSSHLLFTQKYAGRFTDIADSRHVKLAGFQFSRLAGFKFFTTSVGKSRKNMLAVSRALGLSMASSASSAAVAV